jgi:hypothetical protein
MGVENGRALLSRAVLEEDEEFVEDLFNRMRDDCIKEVVLGDRLIRKEACLRMMSLGRKEDRKLGDVNRVSQAVRTLGRVVLLCRESKPDVTLDELIDAANFDLLVDVARRLSVEKDKPALNVGRTIGFLLDHVAQTKIGAALRVNDDVAVRSATNFRKVFQAEWHKRVNSAAVKRINTERRSNVPVISLTEDLRKVREFILVNMKDLGHRL